MSCHLAMSCRITLGTTPERRTENRGTTTGKKGGENYVKTFGFFSTHHIHCNVVAQWAKIGAKTSQNSVGRRCPQLDSYVIAKFGQ